VQVQGLAAICPECGLLVSVGPQTLAEIDPVSAAETQYQPPPLPRQPDSARINRAIYWIMGSVIAVVLILVGTLIVLMARRSGDVAAPALPPAPVAVAPAPGLRAATEPQGSEWFSEKPGPELGPAAVAAGSRAAAISPGQRSTIEPSTTPPASESAPDVAAPPPTPPASRPKPAHPHAALASLKPRQADPNRSRRLTDEQIGDALKRGIAYLESQFSKTRLKGADQWDPETFAGLNALAVYALLHAGQSVGDPRFGPQSELIKGLLDRLKEYPMNGSRATYARSLRISALGVYKRPQDRATMEADLQWLLRASRGGAYTYEVPPPQRTRDHNVWDNSNSQYGALGVWAAADAGLRVPASFWNEVEQHWTATQTHSGGWGYGPGATSATLSMTAAGITMLFVARDQLAIEAGTSQSYLPLSKAIGRALEWLDEDDNAVNIGAHPGYTYYGLERAGLASGYKYFGTHDWYPELAQRLIREQREDGAWDGTDGRLAETCFALLFLARGRYPVFITKLRFDGNWNNRPRDIAVLTRFASQQFERALNFQVADIQRNWWEWSDSPTLFITTDRPPQFADGDVQKIRDFAQAGGIVFTHAERNSEDVNRFFADLARRAFPEHPFEKLPEDHEIYSIVFPIESPRPPLMGVSNGVRLLMVHSPTELSRHWQPFPTRSQRVNSELAINIAAYSAGRRELRNRLASLYVPQPQEKPVGTVPLARLKFDGHWDPEPAAWPRMARIFENRTGIALHLEPTDISDLRYELTPIAHLTGLGDFHPTQAQIDALRVFVVRGGVLLIDAAAGKQQFADAVERKLLPAMFPEASLAPLARDDAILRSALAGSYDLREPLLRAGTTRPSTTRQIQCMRAGAGVILYSRLDLTAALLGSNTIGIEGYAPEYAQRFVHNLVLWTIAQIARQQ